MTMLFLLLAVAAIPLLTAAGTLAGFVVAFVSTMLFHGLKAGMKWGISRVLNTPRYPKTN